MVSPHLPPHQSKPWRLSQTLEERLSSSPKQDGVPFKRIVVLPSDSEFDFVWNSFYASQPHRYAIKRIFVIDNKEQVLAFEKGLPHEDNFSQEELKPPSVLHAWHGLQDEKSGYSICHTGFEPEEPLFKKRLHARPFHGGIFFSSDAQYAVETYSLGSGHLILAWISKAEHPLKKEEFQEKRSPERPSSGTYYHLSLKNSRDQENPLRDEIVSFEKTQTLPRFWVELQPNLPFEPKVLLSQEEILDVIFKALENPLVGQDSELQNVLKKRGKALLIYGDQPVSPSDNTFYTRICRLFEARGEINHLAKKHLLEWETSQSEKSRLKAVSLIKSDVDKGLLQEAWQDLRSLSQTYSIFEEFDSTLYELLPKILPHVPFNDRDLLLGRIIEPLRAFGSQGDLERPLALWFSQHRKELREEKWHQELHVPQLNCYGRALRLNPSNESLYREASQLLAEPFFNHLSQLELLLENGLKKQTTSPLEEDEINLLKRSIQIVSNIRNSFCLTEEERQKLVPIYEKISLFLDKGIFNEQEKALILEGKSSHLGPYPVPYIKICLEALSSWDTTFEKEETLLLFYNLLKAFPLDLQEREKESFFSLLLPKGDKEGFLSPPLLLKEFLQGKKAHPSFKQDRSLLEFAFERVSSEESGVSYLKPLVQAGARHLLSKNSQEAPLELYEILSKGVAPRLLREAYLYSFPKGDLFDKIASIPDRIGHRFSSDFKREAFQANLLEITQENPSPVAIQGLSSTTRYLKDSLIKNLIQEQGDLQRHYSSSHPVARLQTGDVDLHFKQHPSHPFLEYAIYSLTSRLSGRGNPPSQLVRFEVHLRGQPPKVYPVLISETVEGKNLNDLLQENPSPSLDQKQFTEMLLLTLLTRPGDGRATNFILNSKNELWSIDNDLSFVEPILKSFQGETVQFSSILYCLPPSPLDLGVIERWRHFSPELLFLEWLEELSLLEEDYLSIFSERELKELYQDESSIFLKPGGIVTLYTQFHELLSLNKPLEGLDLLRKFVDLRALGIYDTGHKLHLAYGKSKGSPSEKLRMATGRKKELSLRSIPRGLKAHLGKKQEEVQKEDFFSLRKVKEEFLSYITFGLEKEGSDRSTLDLDFSKFHQGGKPDLKKEEMLLKGLCLLVEKNPPKTLIFRNSSILTVEKLKPFLNRGLVHLEIHGAPRLESFEDEKLFNSHPLPLPLSLKTLHISGCPALSSIKIHAPQLDSFKLTHSSKLNALLLDISFHGKIVISDLSEETVDKLLEKGFASIWDSSSFLRYKKMILSNRCLSHMMASEQKFLKKGEKTKAVFIGKIGMKKESSRRAPSDQETDPTYLNLGSGVTIDLLIELIRGSHVTGLDLSGASLGHQKLQALIEVLKNLNLKKLSLSETYLGFKGVNILVELLKQSELTHLDLSHNFIGFEGVKALSEVLPQTKLTSLDLSHNQIGPQGVKALLELIPHLKLEELKLSSMGIKDREITSLAKILPHSPLTLLDLSGNEIGFEVARAVAEVLPTTSLKVLNFSFNDIGAKGAEALFKVLPQTQLTTLGLAGNRVGDREIEVLIEVLLKSRITHLDLKKNLVGSEGAKSLAKVLKASSLTYLDLTMGHLTLEGISALAGGMNRSQLIRLGLGKHELEFKGTEPLPADLILQATSLDYKRNFMNQLDMALFAKAPHPKLTHLNLSSNKIREEGARVLAGLLPHAPITHLDLTGCKIRSKGAIALAEVLPSSSLKDLDLSHNKIGDRATTSLARGIRGSSLLKFKFKSNSISPGGFRNLLEGITSSSIRALTLKWMFFPEVDFRTAKALADALPTSQLRVLKLSHVESEGVRVIAAALPTSYLINLGLEFSDIGLAGAKALAEVLPGSQLVRLSLRGNKIPSSGIKAIAEALPSSSLAVLILTSNFVEVEGAEALGKALPQSNLIELVLESTGIRGKGTEQLAAGLRGSQLKVLSLYKCEIGDWGALVLSRVLKDTSLTDLNLSSNGIGPKGTRVLAKGLLGSQVTKLNFNFSRILKDANAVKNPRARNLDLIMGLSHLECISIGANNVMTQSLAEALPAFEATSLSVGLIKTIGDERLKTLVEAIPRSSVTDLRLSREREWSETQISLTKTVSAIGEMLPLSRLTTLVLEGIELGVEGARLLANGLQGSQITWLGLVYIHLEAEAVKALAEILPTSQLTGVVLRSCRLGNEGIEILAEAIGNSQVETLKLYSNTIKNRGAKALARVLGASRVSDLHLGFNRIGIKGLVALVEALPFSRVSDFQFIHNPIPASRDIILERDGNRFYVDRIGEHFRLDKLKIKLYPKEILKNREGAIVRVYIPVDKYLDRGLYPVGPIDSDED